MNNSRRLYMKQNNMNKKSRRVSKWVLMCTIAGCVMFGYAENMSIPVVYGAEETNTKTYTANGVKYTLNDDKTCSVSGYVSTSNIEKIEIKQTITVNGTTYTVTGIGESAFYDCSSLTSVSIADSVTSIGKYAFRDCNKLKSVKMPSNLSTINDQVFMNCSSLISVDIPDKVTYIGDSAFKNCSSLSNITIPSKLEGIGQHTFERCSSLTSIDIPDSVTGIEN